MIIIDELRIYPVSQKYYKQNHYFLITFKQFRFTKNCSIQDAILAFYELSNTTYFQFYLITKKLKMSLNIFFSYGITISALDWMRTRKNSTKLKSSV